VYRDRTGRGQGRERGRGSENGDENGGEDENDGSFPSQRDGGGRDRAWRGVAEEILAAARAALVALSGETRNLAP